MDHSLAIPPRRRFTEEDLEQVRRFFERVLSEREFSVGGWNGLRLWNFTPVGNGFGISSVHSPIHLSDQIVPCYDAWMRDISNKKWDCDICNHNYDPSHEVIVSIWDLSIPSEYQRITKKHLRHIDLIAKSLSYFGIGDVENLTAEDVEEAKQLHRGYHRHEYHVFNLEVSQIEEGECCPVCLDDNEIEVQILPCSHKIHGRCLIRWLDQSTRESDFKCPVCRGAIEC